MQKETKIFDPRDPATGSGGAELLDPSVANRDGRWWMVLAGQAHGYGPPQLYSASLPAGEPLSATGWTIARIDTVDVAQLLPASRPGAWDGDGGRHCPSYVKGWDPHRNEWVERIYYAGAREQISGPYTIGYAEWDGAQWAVADEPVFHGTEEWEHGSVYEPNVIYSDGKWRMWYVAGANRDNYLAQGYAESADGCVWDAHTQFAPEAMKMFDFCVRPRGDGFVAVYSRVWVAKDQAPPETGLWTCRADAPSGVLADWGESVQIMTGEDRGWHSGAFKPSLAMDDADPSRAFVFFSGMYRTNEESPFPFVFTTGCVEGPIPV
ncbi:MAG TPA: hypothetical protein VKB38_11245 [Terracidiphilus sp.]|nr:hypothetical protein [Terracidiphilus sp.]